MKDAEKVAEDVDSNNLVDDAVSNLDESENQSRTIGKDVTMAEMVQ